MFSNGKLTGFVVVAAISGFMAGNFIETTAVGRWLAASDWGSLIVLGLLLAFFIGKAWDGLGDQGVMITCAAMIAGLIAYDKELPVADTLLAQTKQVKDQADGPINSDNGSIITSNDVISSPINLVRPFGIELGKPFPSDVGYAKVKSTSSRTTYFMVKVPDPHRFFTNIASNHYEMTSSNFYKVIVFNDTNKVESVIARSAFEKARQSVPSCSQANALYGEMKNATGWPSSMTGKWQVSSQSPAGKSYKADLVDRALPETRFRAEFNCKEYTQYLEIQFKYTKFYE